MRIGIDVSPLTRTRTGVGNYTYYLLKHLPLAQRYQGLDCTFHAFSSGMKRVDLGWTARPGGHEEEEGIESHYSLRMPTRLLYSIWATFGRPRVDRLLGGVDVYHATNYFLPPVKSARRVVTFYDLAFLKVPELCSPKVVGPFSKGVPRFARAADAILTCSESTKWDIVDLIGVAPEKVTVAYGAVDEDLVPVPRPEAVDGLAQRYGVRAPFILFVSTLEPRKNVEGLLRAFAMAAKDVPHSLVLIGRAGWKADGLDRLIAELRLADRVQRMGYLRSRDDLAAFYSAADIFVFPSFYEGFGLPVLEAMTCGCPVIASNRASLPEVGGDAAQYVDPDDTEGLAATIRMVLLNEGLAAAMSEKGLEQARRFSWGACARKTFGVYRSLL